MVVRRQEVRVGGVSLRQRPPGAGAYALAGAWRLWRRSPRRIPVVGRPPSGWELGNCSKHTERDAETREDPSKRARRDLPVMAVNRSLMHGAFASSSDVEP
jgi:hypothetical protein